MADFSKEIEKWESLIRRGHFAEVRKDLTRLNLSQIPRKQCLPISHIAYRVNVPSKALRILGPYIKGTKQIVEPVTDLEKGEYALSLSRLGATREAGEILSQLDSKNHPQFFLYEAFSYITEWKYGQAIAPLTHYIEHPLVDEYQRLVGKTNLAACHVFLENWLEAETLLESLIQATKEKGHNLLHGNSLELLSQVYIFNDKLDKAHETLRSALDIFENTSASSEVYVRKWQAIVHLSQRKTDKALKELEAVRKICLEKHLWENIRECDFFLAFFRKDWELFKKVYYGTPHGKYRAKLLSRIKIPIQIENQYKWQLNGGGNQCLNLLNGKFEGGEKRVLKTGKKIHNLLTILSSDFYRPFRLGTLFSYMFPEESFDPFSSPDRIYQLMRRLRAWSDTHNFPLVISRSGGGYRIDSESPISFIKPVELEIKSSYDYQLRLIKEIWGTSPFSLAQVEKKLGISRTQAFYIVSFAGEKQLEKMGAGPKTRYKFCA